MCCLWVDRRYCPATSLRSQIIVAQLVILGTVWLRRVLRRRRRRMTFLSTHSDALPKVNDRAGEKALQSQTSKETMQSKQQHVPRYAPIRGSPQPYSDLVAVQQTPSPNSKLAHRIPTPQFPSPDMGWHVGLEGRSDASSTHRTSTQYDCTSPTFIRSRSSPQLATPTTMRRTPQLMQNPTNLLVAQHHAHGSGSYGSSQSHATAVSSGRSRMAIISPMQPLRESTAMRLDQLSQSLGHIQARSISGQRIPDIMEIEDAMLTLRSPRKRAVFAEDEILEADKSHQSAARSAHLSRSASSPSHPQLLHHSQSKSHGTLHSAHSSNPSVSSSTMFMHQQSMMNSQPTSQAVDFGDASGSSSSAASSIFAPPTPVFAAFKHNSDTSSNRKSIISPGKSPIKRTSAALPDMLFARASTVVRDSQYDHFQYDDDTQSLGLPQPHHMQSGRRLGSTISAYGQAL